MVTGAIYDAATGKTPTLKSMATDAFFGAVGALDGEVVGKSVGAGAKALGRQTGKSLGKVVSSIEGGVIGKMGGKIGLLAEVRGYHPWLLFDGFNGELDHLAVLTYGNPGILQKKSSAYMAPAKDAIMGDIIPAMRQLDAQRVNAGLPKVAADSPITLLACYGAESGVFPAAFRPIAGLPAEAAGALLHSNTGRTVTAFKGILQPAVIQTNQRTLQMLRQPSGFQRFFKDLTPDRIVVFGERMEWETSRVFEPMEL
ncbi:hypothetical protein ABW20_dc0103623 [Dactylellina cionopaga]|nr:hypothetical protein ABW20_dc0103623 [Dactylellina cionopaga]